MEAYTQLIGTAILIGGIVWKTSSVIRSLQKDVIRLEKDIGAVDEKFDKIMGTLGDLRVDMARVETQVSDLRKNTGNFNLDELRALIARARDIRNGQA